MFKALSYAALAIAVLGTVSARAAENPVANAYYNLAVALSEARLANQVCEYNAYQFEVVENLTSAVDLDEGLAARAAADSILVAAIGRNLGFRVATREYNIWTGEGFEAALAKSTFHGPGIGVFGTMERLEFAPGGAALAWKATYDENGDVFEIRWTSTPVTWKVLSAGHDSAEIEVTGAAGATVYEIKSDYNGGFEMHEKNSTENIPAYLSAPSECEA